MGYIIGMDRWNKIRAVFARIVNAGLLMMGGAWLLAQYLSYGNMALDKALDGVDHALALFLVIGLALSSCLEVRTESEKHVFKEPSPRSSGVIPILMTGFALAAVTLLSGNASDFLLLPVLIIIGTLLIALLIWRFASKNADEIGEARFNPEPPAN